MGSGYLNRQSAIFFIFSNHQHNAERDIKVIEGKNDPSKNLEKALQALKQAKRRVANEKKKQNEKKRKAEKEEERRAQTQSFMWLFRSVVRQIICTYILHIKCACISDGMDKHSKFLHLFAQLI